MTAASWLAAPPLRLEPVWEKPWAKAGEAWIHPVRVPGPTSLLKELLETAWEKWRPPGPGLCGEGGRARSIWESVGSGASEVRGPDGEGEVAHWRRS